MFRVPRFSVSRWLLLFGLFPLLAATVGSRWFSVIPIGPIYTLDVLVAVASLALFFGIFREPKSRARVDVSGWIFLLVALFATIRVSGVGFSRLALVDLAPFLYMVYAVLLGAFLAGSKRIDNRLVVKLVNGALLLHWGLLALLQFSGLVSAGWPGASNNIFSIRPDFDGALVAICGAVLLNRFFLVPGKTRYLMLPLAALAWLHANSFGSTAVFFAFVLAAGIVLSLHFARLLQGNRKEVLSRRLVEAFSLVLVLAMAYLLTDQENLELGPIARSLWAEAVTSEAFLGPSGAQAQIEGAEVEGFVSGTATARLNAWDATLGWLFGDSQRLFLGVGFGTSYFLDSGGLHALVGDPEFATFVTRHPHNFVFHVVAILGLPVAVFFLFAWVRVLAISLRAASLNLELAAYPLMLAVLLWISLVGVVFESPFGAIALAGTAGIVFATAGRSKVVRE